MASWVEKVRGAKSCKLPTEFWQMSVNFRQGAQNFAFFGRNFPTSIRFFWQFFDSPEFWWPPATTPLGVSVFSPKLMAWGWGVYGIARWMATYYVDTGS